MFSITVAKEGERGKERGSVCFPADRGRFCPLGPSAGLPAPARPWPRRVPPVLRSLVRDRTPSWDGIWGNLGSQGGFLGAAGFLQPAALCHLCGGLPGGGTAGTDASQGKKAWTKIRGGRAVGTGPGWGGWGPILALPLLPPCCALARQPHRLAKGRDKKPG